MKLALKLPLAFAATLLFVVAAALFGIHSLNRSILTFETDVHRSHEHAAAASHLLSQFKTQVQEWKNTLLRGRDAKHLMQLAWHIGNRHAKAQIDTEWAGIGDRILILRDHVLRDMLIGLGAKVTEISEPFSPLEGAYSHDHGHALLNR